MKNGRHSISYETMLQQKRYLLVVNTETFFVQHCVRNHMFEVSIPSLHHQVRSIGNNTQAVRFQTKETNLYASSGIQTRDLSNRVNGYLRFRPQGHRHQQISYIRL